MSNVVLDVLDYTYDPRTSSGQVRAVIEDVAVIYPQSYDDPCETGPAICEAGFLLSEDDEFPTDSTDLELFFQDLGLNWRLVDPCHDN